MRLLVAALLVLALGASGCRDDDPPDHGGAVPDSAVDAVDCAGAPYRHGRGDYDSGLEKVTDHARGAVDSWLEEEGYGLPDVTYDEVARHDGRTLFAWSEGRSVLAAVVVRDGLDDVEDHHGWGVTSYAVCDPSDWPPQVSDATGVQVWSDADGDRVPTSVIQSFRGAEHCDWQDVTFLWLGEDGTGGEFLGTPDADLGELLRAAYAAQAELPPGATDTGYQREGRELWTTPDAAYLVGTDGDAERWPASRQPIRCA